MERKTDERPAGRARLRLRCPVAVEGKYDKIKLSAVVETPILVLNGFSVFNDGEKKALLRRVCRETGLILLTDSDRAGQFLRNKLKGLLPEDAEGKGVFQVYAPSVEGKEKRKQTPSADGLLGIEGIDTDTLYRILLPFADESGEVRGANVTNEEWYAAGLSGGTNASERRRMLARKAGLPETLTGKALREAVNLLLTREQFEDCLRWLENA